MATQVRTVAQFQTDPKPYPSGDTVTIEDTAANIEAAPASLISQFSAANVDALDSSDNTLTLTFAQYQALGTVALTSADEVTVTLSSAEFNALAASDFTTLGARFVDALDIGGSGINATVSIDAARAAALVGTAGLSIASGDVVTLSDTGANIAALTSSQIGFLAARGVDVINSSTNALTLTLAQYQALGAVALDTVDTVTMTLTSADFGALVAADFTTFGANGIDVLDIDGPGTSASVSITAAMASALIGTTNLMIAAGDSVTLADTGTNIAALSVLEFIQLTSRGVDVIDATNNTLTLTYLQYQSLGSVTLTAADAVTVTIASADFNTLTAANFTSFGANRVDVLDIDGSGTNATVSINAARAAALVGTTGLSIASGDVVTLGDSGANIAALTAAQIGLLAARGVDAIDVSDNVLTLTLAQYQALGSVALTAADVVTVTLTTTEFNALVAADFTALGANRVDVLDISGATNSPVSMTAATAAALVDTTGLSIATGDIVTLADSGANIANLTSTQIGRLAARGVDIIDASDNTVTLTLAQYQALGAVTLTTADVVTVTLTSAEFGALVAADFTTFGTNRVDVLDVDGAGTSATVSISAAQAAALVGTTGLSVAAGDTLTLADTGANIAGLTATQMGLLAARGVDAIDASNNVLALTVAQYQALASVSLTAGDAIALLDTGTNIAALSATQINLLSARGIDTIDSTTNALTLTLAQYQALGSVALTAADAVTMTLTTAEFNARVAADFTAFGTAGIDVLDVDGSATNSAVSITAAMAAAIVGTTSLQIAAGDIVTLADTGANIAGLSAGQIALLSGRGVDAIDSSSNALTLTLAQYQALNTVTLTAADAVTVTLTSAEFGALTAADFTTFGTNRVDVLDVDGGSNSAVSITAAMAAALVGTTGLSIATGDVVTLVDTGANIAALTATQIGLLAARGVDSIDSSSNALTLTVAQYQALGTVTLTAGDTVTLGDTGANIAALSATQIGNLAGNRIDIIDATNNALSLTVAQYQALGAVTLTGADVVTLADTGASLAALTSGDIGDLAGDGIDIIDSSTNALTLDYAQYQALGSVALTVADTVTVTLTSAEFGALAAGDFTTFGNNRVDVLDIDGSGTNASVSITAAIASALAGTGLTIAAGDIVTLADSGANIAALTATQIGLLAARGVDVIDSTTNALTLTLAQYQALGTVTLTGADVVTLSDTGANIAALTTTQIAALAGNGIDIIDASNNTMSLTVAQYQALGAVNLTDADVVTLADTGASIAALSAAQFDALDAAGIDIIDSTTNALTLTLAQYQALGAVTLTSGDTVTLSDTGANLAALSTGQLGALSAAGIDRIDVSNNAITLTSAQAQAVGNLPFAGNDTVTINGTGGGESIAFRGGYGIINAGAGTDTADFSLYGSAVWVGLSNSLHHVATRDATHLDSGTWRTIGELNSVENLIGTVYSDYLGGDANSNTFYYTAGVDTYDGLGGTDTADYSMFGSAVSLDLVGSTTVWTRDNSALTTGTWRYISQLSNIENLVGTSFNDFLRGNSANNVMDGGSGTDTVGFLHNLNYYSFTVNGSSIVVTGAGEGIDTILDTVENFQFADGTLTRAQVLTDMAGPTFTAGADTETLPLLGGTFDALGGDDRLTYGGGVVSINGNSGTDTVSFATFGSAVWVGLTNVNGHIFTRDATHLNSGAWRTIGNLANVENLVDTAFSDYLAGDANANTFFYTGGVDTYDGLGGTDTADYSLFTSAVSLDLVGSTTVWTRDNTALTTGTWRYIGQLSNIENLVGSSFDDLLRGNSANNQIDGGNGTDTVSLLHNLNYYSISVNGSSIVVTGGGEGTDTIVDTVENFQFADQTLTRTEVLNGLVGPTFTAGADTLTLPPLGGTFDALGGDDLITYGGGVVSINGNNGTDRVDFSGFSSAVWIGLTNVNGQIFTRDAAHLNSGTWRTIGDLTGVENLVGTAFNDYLAGDANANVFFYTGGVDAYDGLGGTDTADYSLFGSAVSIDLAGATQAWTRDTTSLNTGTWRYIGSLTSVENLVGTAFNDFLRGNSASNTIDGGGGTGDTVSFLNRLAYYTFSQNGQSIVVTSAGEGTDTILDTVEIFQFADRTLTRAQMLTGLTAPTFTAGADTLSLPILGGTFDALGGNDRLTYTDGMVTIDGNGGTDTVDFTGFGSAVWVGLENLNGQAFTRDAANLNSGAWRTIGNLSNVENLIGTAFADYLAGDANANTFFYTGGVDAYDGMGGTDTVDYSLFTSAVSIELSAANPAWTRDSNNLNSGTWRSIGTLSNIENVVGTSFDDYLSGNGADNLLTGGSGNDTFAFRPGFGDDTVADFDPGHDSLAFDRTLFATAIAAYNAAADDGNGNVVITFDANNTVTLTGQSLANLQPSDFRII